MTLRAIIASLFLIGAPESFEVDEAKASGSRSSVGQWSSPERVARGRGIESLAIARARGGFSVAVWSVERSIRGSDGARRLTGSAIYASVKQAGHAHFGRPRRLSPRGATTPRLGMSDDGETLVSWVSRSRSGQVASIRPGEGWGTPTTLVPGPIVGSLALSMAADGGTVAAWGERPSDDEVALEGMARPPGGIFGPAQTIAGEGELGLFLAVDAAVGGTGIVAFDGPCVSPTQAALLSPDGMFGPPITIPNSRCPNIGVRVASDDAGGSVALISGYHERPSVKASMRMEGGPFSPAQRISEGPSIGGELAVSAKGRAIAVWTFAPRDRSRGLVAAVRPPDGEFRRPRPLAGPNSGGLEHLSMSSSGEGLVVWQSLRTGRVKASFMPVGKRFGRAEKVSPRLARDRLAPLAGAVGPSGRAVAAWTDGQHIFVATRRRSG